MLLYVPAKVVAALTGRPSIFVSIGAAGIAAALRVAGIRYRLEGGERVPQGRACVLCINHTSALDVVAFLALRSRCSRLLILYKAELGSVAVVGGAFDAAGFIAIDRQSSNDARHALGRGTEALIRGDSILVSPEGTRSSNGRLAPFKKGVFVMAIAAGAPIVPVAVIGAGDALPKGRFVVRSRELHVRVGEPIETRMCTYDDRDLVSAETGRQLAELLPPATD
jgi:1-acyl-sn-glycerol-3-phosphate acyltransferase